MLIDQELVQSELILFAQVGPIFGEWQTNFYFWPKPEISISMGNIGIHVQFKFMLGGPRGRAVKSAVS